MMRSIEIWFYKEVNLCKLLYVLFQASWLLPTILQPSCFSSTPGEKSGQQRDQVSDGGAFAGFHGSCSQKAIRCWRGLTAHAVLALSVPTRRTTPRSQLRSHFELKAMDLSSVLRNSSAPSWKASSIFLSSEEIAVTAQPMARAKRTAM